LGKVTKKTPTILNIFSRKGGRIKILKYLILKKRPVTVNELQMALHYRSQSIKSHFNALIKYGLMKRILTPAVRWPQYDLIHSSRCVQTLKEFFLLDYASLRPEVKEFLESTCKMRILDKLNRDGKVTITGVRTTNNCKRLEAESNLHELEVTGIIKKNVKDDVFQWNHEDQDGIIVANLLKALNEG